MHRECLKSCNCNVCRNHAPAGRRHITRHWANRKLRRLWSLALRAQPDDTPIVGVSIAPQG